ncbi:MAG: hypothetical protein ABJB12_23640 [Pseudomonadota bacterium]
MKPLLRGSIATFVSSVALFVSSTAFAEGEPCYVDKDCAGTACGDAVCNWTKMSPNPSGMKIFYCNPAGTDPVGTDGWCTTSADCKCMAQGATCNQTYCTFTKPPAGSGGASAGGASAGGASSAGASSAGAPGATAGASAGGGPSTSTAGAASTGTSSDSGGCSISLPGKTNSGAAAALAALGLGLVLARRRR